jgi:hypothetical protein
MNSFKQRLIAIAKPKPAPWKRPILWFMSLLVAAVCVLATHAQVQEQSANYTQWVAIGVFGILSVAGIVAAAVGDDVWVALFVSDVD